MTGISDEHNKFNSCKNCPDRELACHDVCEGFKFRQKKVKDLKARRNEDKYEYTVRPKR